MEKSKLRYYKKILEQHLAALADGAKETVDDMVDDDDTFPDPNDRATLESDRNFVLRIRDREWKLKAKIEEALERIADGTFGVCESCGEDISEERLNVRPVTTLCIKCKEEQEKQEKARQAR